MLNLRYPHLAIAPESLDKPQSQRSAAQLLADACRLDHSPSARRQPRLRLNVRDVSLGGLSAIADLPVQEGEHVSVRFPPNLSGPMWSAYGHVVRCEPSARGYRVAVEFDPRPAA
jgi:hypothetical protein